MCQGGGRWLSPPGLPPPGGPPRTLTGRFQKLGFVSALLSLPLSRVLGARSKPQTAEIVRSFRGHVRRLLRHAEASAVVEYAYNDRAVLEQRSMLTEELYGNTFQLYKVAFRNVLLTLLPLRALFPTFQRPVLRMYFCSVWSAKRPLFPGIIFSLA